MTSEQFTYWLQGFFEINDPKTIDEKQTQIIKDHLALVFNKVTPDRKDIWNTPIINPLPQPYVNPYTRTVDPYHPPFTVTCSNASALIDTEDQCNKGKGISC